MSISTVDRAGVTISGLCLIHCLLLPLAASVLPMVGLIAENEVIHKALVLLAIFPASFAFFKPTSKFPQIIRSVALFGILALIAGGYVEAFHDFEKVLTVLGGMSLATAHLLRLKLELSHRH